MSAEQAREALRALVLNWYADWAPSELAAVLARDGGLGRRVDGGGWPSLAAFLRARLGGRDPDLDRAIDSIAQLERRGTDPRVAAALASLVAPRRVVDSRVRPAPLQLSSAASLSAASLSAPMICTIAVGYVRQYLSGGPTDWLARAVVVLEEALVKGFDDPEIAEELRAFGYEGRSAREEP